MGKTKQNQRLNSSKRRHNDREVQTDPEYGEFSYHVSAIQGQGSTHSRDVHREAILMNHIKKLSRDKNILQTKLSKCAQIPNLIRAMKSQYEVAMENLYANIDAMKIEQANRNVKITTYLEQHKMETQRVLDARKRANEAKEMKIRNLTVEKKLLSDQMVLLQEALQLEERAKKTAQKESYDAIEERAEMEAKMKDKLFLAGNQKCGSCQAKERVQEDLMDQITQKHQEIEQLQNTISEHARINQILSNDLVNKRALIANGQKELRSAQFTINSYRTELVKKQGEVAQLKDEKRLLEGKIRNIYSGKSASTTPKEFPTDQNPNILTPPEEDRRAELEANPTEMTPHNQIDNSPTLTNNTNNAKISEWVAAQNQAPLKHKRSAPILMAQNGQELEGSDVTTAGSSSSIIDVVGYTDDERSASENGIFTAKKRARMDEPVTADKLSDQTENTKQKEKLGRRGTEEVEEGEMDNDGGSEESIMLASPEPEKRFFQPPPRRNEVDPGRALEKGWRQPTLFFNNETNRTRGPRNHISPYLDAVDHRPATGTPPAVNNGGPWMIEPNFQRAPMPVVRPRPPTQSRHPQPQFSPMSITPQQQQPRQPVTHHSNPMLSRDMMVSSPFNNCNASFIGIDFCEDPQPPPVRPLDGSSAAGYSGSPGPMETSSTWRRDRESFFMNRPPSQQQHSLSEIDQQLREQIEKQIQQRRPSALPPAYELQQQPRFPPRPIAPIPTPPDRFPQSQQLSAHLSQSGNRIPVYEQNIIKESGGILPWHNSSGLPIVLPPASQPIRPPCFFQR